MIIAVTGHARTGKDTIGECLVAEHGFRRFAVADPLKAILLALDPFVDGSTRLSGTRQDAATLAALDRPVADEVTALTGMLTSDLLPVELGVSAPSHREAEAMVDTLDPLLRGTVTVRGLVAEIGWDGAKTHRVHGGEVRRLLQVLGTEVLRPQYGETVLADALVERIAASWASDGVAPVVVTDLRASDEALARILRERGGRVWHVRRPGVGPANAHTTEQVLPDWLVDRVLVNDGTLADLRSLVDGAVTLGHDARGV